MVEPTFAPRHLSQPYEVQNHGFTSQHQELKMACLDVPASGDVNGRTVLLLHGKNFCAATWEETIVALASAGYRVVAPDQIGFSKSSKPEQYQYTLHQLAQNTHELLAVPNLGETVVMPGASIRTGVSSAKIACPASTCRPMA
ncbi:alpha/beta fold hydrolase, partial [uncultured Jannaschia sp.]|uniref:alpha/beta fold hydrolase n=1 Tax=uncultured Jannaschia sp. TaxID=293347 RepID=UPI003435AEB2